MHGSIRIQTECVSLMLDKGWTSQQVSKLKDISHSTLRNWRNHYLSFGLLPAESRANRMKLGPRVWNRKVTPPVKTTLLTIVKDKPWAYLDELQQMLRDKAGITLSLSVIYKVLRRECRWSLHKVQLVARQRDEVLRAEHHALLSRVTDNPRQFIFIDETSKDKDMIRRRRAWQPVGYTTTISEYFPDGQNNSYTLLAAADMDGFVLEACELVRRKRCANDNDESAGTIDTDRFVSWVQDSLVPTLGNYLLGEPRSIVVLDNASIHVDDRVVDLVVNAGALIIFQAPYSPDHNPIELCFSKYKYYLRRHSAQVGAAPYQTHFAALQSVTSRDMQGYYRHVGGIRNIPDEVVENNDLEIDVDAVVAAAAAMEVLVN